MPHANLLFNCLTCKFLFLFFFSQGASTVGAEMVSGLFNGNFLSRLSYAEY